MKVKGVKFYIGVQMAGVVRTHTMGNTSQWLKSAEAIPNLGIIFNTSMQLENGKEVSENILVPFNNVQWCVLDDAPVAAPKVVKAKGA